jgi:tetratricopeptide (TPR) repeat protein
VAVVGSSGSGKSSLVRSGLIPSLQSGFMAGAGSSWRIATFRPGEDPVGHLAAALASPQVLGSPDPELADTNRVLVEVTLRRSTLGLVEAVQQARLPAGENLLVLVDQFEELFRFRESRLIAHSRDEAIAFVKLLLQAAARTNPSIYVAITMRSDFIGDCMNFPGLSEAVNSGLYLVGRMSRDGLRAAITGPVAVAGGTIAPRLVTRVLNDLGDDHDQLPLVQHALSRTWAHWADAGMADRAIDIEDYEAVGGFRASLSRHADEAFEEADRAGRARTTERVFKALTDTVTDQRGVRRPTPVGSLADITECTEAQVIEVVEIFRRPGRSFLMPPASVPLTRGSIIDLSHESLMRCWGRLITWAEEERAAASFYKRLSQAAAWHAEGTAGLWRNPELEFAQRWRGDTAPTAAWAERYDAGFARAMAFLDRSLEERDRAAAALERERRAKLRRTQLVAGVLATMLVIATALGVFAWMQRDRANHNLNLARQAVDESLAAANRDASLLAADMPQVQALRGDLLAKAESFYREFMRQEPRDEGSRRDVAIANFRLGDISRMLGRPDEAERYYRDAIERLGTLTRSGGDPQDRQSLALAYNWLGETLRQVGRGHDAGDAYDRALALLQQLVRDVPGEAAFQEALGRVTSNRGIARNDAGDKAGAEADFREAIRLLEPLAATAALQDLGRAANNLAGLFDDQGRNEARTFYERAIAVHERLLQQQPDNAEYQLELATFSNNLAVFLDARGAAGEALEHSRRAVNLLTALARPAPSLGIERADALTLRGMILQTQDAQRATDAYAAALTHFRDLGTTAGATRMPKFHMRYGELLARLAGLARDPATASRGRDLLARGLDQYIQIASTLAASGSPAEVRAAHDAVAAVIPEVDARDARRLRALEENLRQALERR